MQDGMVKDWSPFALYNLVTPQFVPSKPSSQILNHFRPVTSVCVAGTVTADGAKGMFAGEACPVSVRGIVLDVEASGTTAAAFG